MQPDVGTRREKRKSGRRRIGRRAQAAFRCVIGRLEDVYDASPQGSDGLTALEGANAGTARTLGYRHSIVNAGRASRGGQHNIEIRTKCSQSSGHFAKKRSNAVRRPGRRAEGAVYTCDACRRGNQPLEGAEEQRGVSSTGQKGVIPKPRAAPWPRERHQRRCGTSGQRGNGANARTLRKHHCL